MGFSEIENAEQKLKMNPAVAEIGGSYEFKPNGSTKHAGGVSSLKLGHFPYGLCNKGKEKLPFSVLIASLVLNVILIIVGIGIGIGIGTTLLRRSEVLPSALPSPCIPTECCPDGWIGYQRKCYYFSKSEGNWTYSQNYCTFFNASLVVIDSQEEMVSGKIQTTTSSPKWSWFSTWMRFENVFTLIFFIKSFLRRYKGPADHWIGLQRIDDQEPWRWIDGTIFNNWFEIRGGGECAYINHQGVASSNGLSEEPWICSKPVHRLKRALDVRGTDL